MVTQMQTHNKPPLHQTLHLRWPRKPTTTPHYTSTLQVGCSIAQAQLQHTPVPSLSVSMHALPFIVPLLPWCMQWIEYHLHAGWDRGLLVRHGKG